MNDVKTAKQFNIGVKGWNWIFQVASALTQAPFQVKVVEKDGRFLVLGIMMMGARGQIVGADRVFEARAQLELEYDPTDAHDAVAYALSILNGMRWELLDSLFQNDEMDAHVLGLDGPRLHIVGG